MLGKVSEVLDIPSDVLKASILRDQEVTLDNFLSAGNNKPHELKSTPISLDAHEEIHSEIKQVKNF